MKMNKTVRIVSVLLFLCLFLVSFQPVRADIESGQPDVTVAAGGARNTFFPDVEKLQNGDLIVVYYDSPAHTSQSGRISMVRSADDGQTWTAPTTVADSVYDDRDPSVMQTSDGTLLLTYFSTDWSQSPSKILGTYRVRSNDGGFTWSSPVLVETKLDYAATTSKVIELDNGDLLIPRYGKMPGHWQSKIMIGRSPDGGISWPQADEVEIPNPYGTNWVEPALADLGNGHLMVMIRTAKYAHEAHSYDNGLTWTTPVPTDMEAHASNLLVLDPGSSAPNILHTWGDYSGLYAFGRPVVGQIIQADGTPVSERVLMYAGHCGDESYPSSVRLDDGRIFTVYYDSCAKKISGTFSTVNDFLNYEEPTTIWDSETGKLDLWKMYKNGSLQISTDMNYIHSNFHPHGPIDGNLTYNYSAAKVQTGEGAYWSIELDQSYPFSKIGIILKQSLPETANVYLSADGVNWGSPVAEYEDVIMNQMQYIVFDQPVHARFAKVEILESSGTDILCEFTLFVPTDTGTAGAMLNRVDQFGKSGQINAVFADHLTYRLTVIQQLVSQNAISDAVAYVQDFLQTIRDPSVTGQELISEMAATTLSAEADLFIRFIS
ncbi:exo-alpha-sialidase [Paenibacillus sp. GYB004]|uniref:exo-alpha-sialidase n=1 Tax=Paenibacillus sp. GYB004 TaxID=2994393 RepID=UPI002F96A7E3